MKRSVRVTAPLLAATAVAWMAGCRKPEMQRCVDESNRVVDDSLCANLPTDNQQPTNMGGHGYVPIVPLYHLYYGGWGGYALGTAVGGGSLSPAEGHGYVNSRGVRTGTTRGGFGGWFSSRGGGGGS